MISVTAFIGEMDEKEVSIRTIIIKKTLGQSGPITIVLTQIWFVVPVTEEKEADATWLLWGCWRGLVRVIGGGDSKGKEVSKGSRGGQRLKTEMMDNPVRMNEKS
jgi:hypothetical protein